jgi:hypothetical protein
MSSNNNGPSIIKDDQGHGHVTDAILDRFIEIQSQIEVYEHNGVFDGLKIVEEEFEALEKSKRQAEINNKVLTEQTKKVSIN